MMHRTSIYSVIVALIPKSSALIGLQPVLLDTSTIIKFSYPCIKNPWSYQSQNIQDFLVPHNCIRANLGLRPLQWSEKLASFANSWANQRKKDCALIHSNTDYGENIFWGSGKDWTPSNAVAAWAAEKKYYNYKMNTCIQNKDCLHYTQMVWKQSLRVGCAKVTCKSGDTFITCNYDPHGNVIGQKPF
ncbi:hypothetical protein AQUCO_06800039v1 [Aquilegia coerulea]|uniref:SCP domain-containing protein n=1 Tax=Aquilegia coerulea TaxID=218851 RepID=A0A2G5CBD5_AQUCA|nr:hypothetical protein AQUCO_06800039v1 [Aquilegia coerulea]